MKLCYGRRKINIPFFVVLISLLSSMSSQSSNSTAADIRIDNVHIYQTALKSFSQKSRLYLGDKKIINITPMTDSPLSANNIIDGQNKYIIPGLTDLHVHIGAAGSNYSQYQHVPLQGNLNAYLYSGVTQVVDLFSFDNTLMAAQTLGQTQITPNLYFAGALFTNTGGHGTQFGDGAIILSADTDLDKAWQEHMARKPHVTKAVIETFGGHGATLTDKQLRDIGERSKAENLPYFVHVSSLFDAKRAIKAGATALAHGINYEPVDNELIDLMIKHGVAYIPTLSVLHNIGAEKENQYISSQGELLNIIPKKLLHCLFEQVPALNKWQSYAWEKRQTAYNNILALHQAGVVIGAGSDAGNPYTLHGVSLHAELQWLKAAGLTNAEVINSATNLAAGVIYQANTIGEIAKGYEANFVMLNTNPLVELSALMDISVVYKAGVKVDRNALLTMNKGLNVQGDSCGVSQNDNRQAALIIDDFSQVSYWKVLSDQIMQGQSTSEFTLNEQQLKITTDLGNAGSFGAWAGIQRPFNQLQNASVFNGVEITYKGSNIPFWLSLHHSMVKDWDHFSVQLPPSKQWKTKQIPFEQFKQMGFGQQYAWSANALSGISFLWRNNPKETLLSLRNTLEVKHIKYY